MLETPIQPKSTEPAEDQLVKQMRLRMEQDNLRNMQQNRRLAHDRAVREGYPPGSAQYEAMMRDAETKASGQNIEATNKFRQFATQREDELRSNDLREFEVFNKYVESDIGQSLIAGVAAEGGDWRSAIGNLYTTDENGRRVLKPENRDKSKVELIRSSFEETVNGIATNPEGDELDWGPAEKQAWVDKKMSQYSEQLVQGLDTTDEQNQAKNDSEARIDQFLETGDISGINPDDWKNLTGTKLSEAKTKTKADGHKFVEVFEDYGATKSFGSSGNEYVTDAEERYIAENPWAVEGQVVEKGGTLYVITEPNTRKSGSTKLQQERRYIATMAKPLSGGPEIELHRSNDFDHDKTILDSVFGGGW
jgi:hypothetical protein